MYQREIVAMAVLVHISTNRCWVTRLLVLIFLANKYGSMGSTVLRPLSFMPKIKTEEVTTVDAISELRTATSEQMETSSVETFWPTMEDASIEFCTTDETSEPMEISNECGIVTSSEVLTSPESRSSKGRISDAVKGSAPWTVRLYVRERDHLCSGTLIDRQWVVTAAHCFHGDYLPAKDLSILLGDHRVLDSEQSEMLIPIKDVYEHEDFDPDTFENDIALVRLMDPIHTYNNYIRPICLGNRTKDRNLMYPGVFGRVNGWSWTTEGGSASEYLKEVYVQLIGFKVCTKHFRPRGVTFTRNMFCTGRLRGGTDACQRNDGKPFSVEDETGKWYLMGIENQDNGCGQYGVYTRFSKYLDWVEETLNKQG